MVTDVTDLLLHPVAHSSPFAVKMQPVWGGQRRVTLVAVVGADEALCPHSRLAHTGALEGLWGTQGGGGSDTSGLSFLGGFQPPHSLTFPAQKP